MAESVSEIMSPELFWLTPGETCSEALLAILSLGITGAPVVDGSQQPLGMVSLRDLVGERGGRQVQDRMTAPAVTVRADSSIAAAARVLSDHNVHRLVVVDPQGHAVGVVSSMDLVRGLMGLPAQHPAALLRADHRGLNWSQPALLNEAAAQLAPAAPGLLVLIHGGAARPEIPVWAETTDDLQGRLRALVAEPGDVQHPPQLAYLLTREAAHLRFRTAEVRDTQQRLDALLEARRGLST